MNHKDFTDVVARRMQQCNNTLLLKNAEYSSDKDKLHNFKRAAEVLGCSPVDALMGMKVKHTVSIMDILAKINAGFLPDIELWDEKLGDEINYLLLLDGMVRELIDG